MTTNDNPILPLAGRRILVTRAPHQASELAERLRELGATPILLPTIEIGPPASLAALDRAAAILSDQAAPVQFDLVAFTSANGVQAFHERAQVLGLMPKPRRLAVVGTATARALEAIGLRADVMPAIFTAEALAEALLPEARGRRMLLVLAEDAPMVLRDALVAAGAEVTVAAGYRNHIPERSIAAASSLFADSANPLDAVTFTSASTAANLMALLQAAGLTLPEQVIRASIGPITSRALRELGLPPQVEAPQSTIAGLIAALADYFRQLA